MWLLFFCLIGGCMGHSLFVLKDEIHSTEGKSVGLPASYKLSQPFQMWPSFLWSKGEYNILYYSLLNGSIDGNGFPTWSSGECTIFPRYAGRVEFSEHNASLVLNDVQQDDSGSYSLTLISAESTLSIKINLHVAGRNPSFNSREETVLGSILSQSSEIREEYVKKLQDTYSHNETMLVFVCVTVLLFASIIFLSTYIRRINAKCYTDAGKPTYACVKEKYLHKVREALGRQSLLGKPFRLGKAVVVEMQSPINPLKPAVCKRLTDEDAQ